MKLTAREREGLEELQKLINGFILSEKENPAVQDWIADAEESTLLTFLRCKKFDPQLAWETLKCQGEYRLEKYPEIYPETMGDNMRRFADSNLIGILKGKTPDGKRVLIWDGSNWDPEELPIQDFTAVWSKYLDILMTDEDALKNGYYFIQQCANFQLKHVSQFSVGVIRRITNTLWYGYPMPFSGTLSLNAPETLVAAVKLARPFFPSGLVVEMYGPGKGVAEIQKLVPAEMLPKFLGGPHELADILDKTTPV